MLKKYLRDTYATIEQVVREPRSIGAMFRAGLIRLCQSRGGGLYGLGYVITFVVFEARAIGVQIAESDSAVATLAGFVLEALLRLGGDTLLSMLYAFIWPVWILQYFQGWGVLALVVGFLGYNRFLRPLTERAFPELKRPELKRVELEMEGDP